MGVRHSRAFACLVAMGVFFMGCSCGRLCVERGCARHSEVVFAQPIRDAGDYSLTVVPFPDGRALSCVLHVVNGAGRLEALAEGCEGGSFLLSDAVDGGAPPPDVVGLSVPGHFTSAEITVGLGGATIYEGRAELDHERIPPNACDQDACRVPVLIAR